MICRKDHLCMLFSTKVMPATSRSFVKVACGWLTKSRLKASLAVFVADRKVSLG